MTWKWM